MRDPGSVKATRHFDFDLFRFWCLMSLYNYCLTLPLAKRPESRAGALRAAGQATSGNTTTSTKIVDAMRVTNHWSQISSKMRGAITRNQKQYNLNYL